ncbi:GLPGLI family protein [Frigoriflavimonas asaccharolytica]|uniref:GLPGLI family protein n=1 Tax=Frigoriflavimonas asaccharolytica TaxID=2735899 RepID=A0A8J8G836_9FLAO|nr:GLPGLI family protein [Frigoriflavimonas asaccharolytica]NRS92903.1 GLPGLI family protein [Frigoriflavimonas asaccharolytica]
MKFLSAILLFLVTLLSAQNHRFVYDYTFVKDSLEQDKPISEAMTLDITPNGSRYYSYGIYERDSTMQAEMSKQLKMATNGSNISFKSISTSSKATIKSVVNKSYPNFAISSNEKMGMNTYKVTDARNIIWKIQPEKMMVGKFNAQKATTEMYGRRWTAWFSTELPFQDGPYKFHGLPGLIVKIEDETKSHIIELQGVKILPKDFAFTQDNEMFSGSTITLDYNKFKKAYLENRENPSKGMRQMSSGMGSTSNGSTFVSSSFVMKDQNGKVLDPNKMMNEMDAKAKEANKKNNNLLELDLLK